MKRLCLYFRWRTALKKSDFWGTFQETTEQAGPFSTNVWNKWTMCGQSVDQKTAQPGRCGQFFGKKCYEKIFLREKESEILSTSPQSHTAPTPPLLPGKGNSSEEYFRSPSLALLWHNRSHLSRVRRHRIGGSALDRWFRLCKLANQRRGMKDP